MIADDGSLGKQHSFHIKFPFQKKRQAGTLSRLVLLLVSLWSVAKPEVPGELMGKGLKENQCGTALVK